MLACRARALIDGRYAPSVDDVLALAPPVLRHRMAVSFAGARRGDRRRPGHRADDGAAQVNSPRTVLENGAVVARDRAEQAAAALPPLLVAAERVAATVAQGVHGRRRVGQGETFWQFRQYQPGDAAARIDWRESAKSQRLYVRETEWEAAQSVWLWRDASASMDYSSAGYIPGGDWPTKRDRAELILMALASLLVRGGERLALLGSGVAPISGRVALTRLAQSLGSHAGATGCRRSSLCRAPANSC